MPTVGNFPKSPKFNPKGYKIPSDKYINSALL